MKQFLLVTASLLAGFAGGVVGARVHPAQEPSSPKPIVRAHRFELVSDSGQVISEWKVNEKNQTVLAFTGNEQSVGTSAVGTSGNSPKPGIGAHTERLSIGALVDGTPFLTFRGSDGKTRVRLYLNLYDKPILLMEDETRPRVALGIGESDTPSPKDNDWVLDFYPERARIGMFTEHAGGETNVRGFLIVNKNKVKYP